MVVDDKKQSQHSSNYQDVACLNMITWQTFFQRTKMVVSLPAVLRGIHGTKASSAYVDCRIDVWVFLLLPMDIDGDGLQPFASACR